MRLPILYYDHPMLRTKTQQVTEITDEIRALVRDLEDTRVAYNGLGLAAPQVGKSLAVCVVSIPDDSDPDHIRPGPTHVYINPRLSAPSKECWTYTEGCLSIPKIYAPVTRPVHITVTAMGLDGKEFTESLSWWHARAIMHENDHLNGVLFLDRLEPEARRLVAPKLRALKRMHG